MKRKQQSERRRKETKIGIGGDLQIFLDQVQLKGVESSTDEPELNQEDWERVRINVSGTIFETYRSTLTKREGSIFKEDETLQQYYDETNKEYYFDRNPKAFEAIFEFMQCGILRTPTKVPGKNDFQEWSVLFVYI